VTFIIKDTVEHRQTIRQKTNIGQVTLVGAGPGAADLLTLRAVAALERADVVYYDSLVDVSILDFAKEDAEKIFVGKRKGFAAVSQDKIQDLVILDAIAGKDVVRLKGGDPFVFGRGGEEVADYRSYNIPVNVVPGITAALAAAAEQHLPLTHRSVATAVTFATGHTQEGSLPDLKGLVSDKRTLVIYMGLTSAGEIVNHLQSVGVAGDISAAVIEQASLPGQRMIRSTVENLVSDIETNHITSPALLVIGDVTALGIEGTVREASKEPFVPFSKPGEFSAWVQHPLR